MEKITWFYKHFNDLSVLEYHHILFLRTEVFVVEQNCPYQEVDKKDVVSYHLYGVNANNEVVAVTRIVPQNVSYKEISIGRVAINKKYRGTGLAHELMLKTFEAAGTIFGKQAIRISAQEYLLNYYSKHGFNKVGEMYLEDDIPHIEMLRPIPAESSASNFFDRSRTKTLVTFYTTIHQIIKAFSFIFSTTKQGICLFNH